MNTTIRKYRPIFMSVILVLACFLLLIAIGSITESRRKLPAKDILPILRVAKQSDVYRAYRNAGIKGAHVVQFGPHFHLEPFFPHEEAGSVPFPIRTFDVRLFYEQGVSSHTWLFIANRNGLVRKVTSVLPDGVFLERTAALDSDFAFRKSGTGYRGFSYDLPREIYPFSEFSCPDEPVVVNVDAGSFAGAIRPQVLYASLRQSCRDVRMLVLVDSVDNDEVTKEMRRDLRIFKELLERNGI